MKDLERYKCQINLSEIGHTGQLKLSRTRLLCIGAGGLANSALSYLAAAGVGKITVVDGDTVNLGNLHRQILFTKSDVGRNKAEVAVEKLVQQNPDIECISESSFLDINNAQALISQHDIVIDCTDNFYARYLVSDVCKEYGKPDIFSAVIGFEGYITIFSLPDSPCYRCLYPEPPSLDNVGNCSDLGVLGVVPGIFGLFQANEVIKFALGIESDLIGSMLKMDLKNMSFSKRILDVSKNCVVCCDEIVFNELNHFTLYETNKLTTIDASKLDDIKDDYFCIDVREQHEYDEYNLGFAHIPCSSFSPEKLSKLGVEHSSPILVCCAHGIRSKAIVALLVDAGFKNAVNLDNGIEKYRFTQKHV